MKHCLLAILIGFILGTPFLCAQTNAPAASPRDQLQQLTEQLQKSPNDQALREKIIALALRLDPKPATPDAATEAEGAAEYAFKNAKVNSDYSDAAKQYEKALLLAPWLAADYFNCGMAHEKAGENKEAICSFKFYLLAAPNADDVQAVKKRIGGLQYAVQKKASDEAAEAAAKAEEAAHLHIGSNYGGGIVFYLDGTGQHGLIAAPSDQGTGSWYQAVQLCKGYRGGGYSDWFMPSIDQLNTLYQQRNVVGGFADIDHFPVYWSSTEGAGGAAYNGVWIQVFDDKGRSAGNKGAEYIYNHVRAIRAF